MRQIFLLALRIGYQQPDLIVSGLPVVNDSQAAAFAAPASRPTQFAKTSTARYDPAPIGTQDQRELQLSILIVIHELPDQARERGRLNNFHIPDNTPMADSVNPKFPPQPAMSAHSCPTKRQFALQGRGWDLDASQRMSAAGIFTRIPGTGSCRLTGNSQGVGCGHDKSAWSRIPACPRNANFRRLFRLASYQQPRSPTSTHETSI